MRTAWLVGLSVVALLAAVAACRSLRDLRPPIHEPVAHAAATPQPATPAAFPAPARRA